MVSSFTLRRSFAVIAVMAAAGLAGSAQTLTLAKPEILNKVGIVQKLNDQLPLDAAFLDETGKAVRLGDYFRDSKPVVLALVYYKCPMLCNLELDGMFASLKRISLRPGADYRVIALSFAPEETPELAAAKRETYLKKFNQPDAAAGIHFLTGKAPEIQRVTEAAGFHYAYDKRQDQFAHASAIMVVTPHGRLARYFYGIHYNERDLRLGLVEASEEKIGSPADEIILFCFHYDPTTGRYGLAIMNVLRAGGALTTIALLLGVFLLFRKDRAGKRDAADVDQNGHWRSV